MDTQHSGAEVVRQIVSVLGRTTPAARFAELLYASASGDEIAPDDAVGLATEASQLFDFVRQRAVGSHKVRVRPALAGRATLVEVVNDDMPFLVDSVMGEIQARSLRVRLVVHPIFKCQRSPDGSIASDLTPADQNWGDGRQESVIAVHLDPISGDAATDLAAALADILSEVRISVSDWRAMLKRVDSAIRVLDDLPAHVPADIKAESLSFMRWLQDGHFTLLGVREYRFAGSARDSSLAPVDGTSLGLLRDSSKYVVARDAGEFDLTPRIREFMLGPSPLLVTKSDLVCRVHRRTAMDYIAVKLYARGARGGAEPTGELRIVGLFTSRAYTQPTQQIPFVRHKVSTVLSESGFPPASHAGKTLVNILDTFPRDELFQIGETELCDWSSNILDLELRPRVRLLARFDRFERFVSVLLYAPRDRYNTAVRERIGALLTGAFGGHVSAFQPYFSEGPLVRVHFIITRERGIQPDVDLRALEREVGEILKSWTDRVHSGLDRLEGEGISLAERYLSAFPSAYVETYAPDRAIEDMRRIERLSATKLPVAIDFYRDVGTQPNRLRAAVYRFGEPIRLSERVPLLENLGFSVIDERSYRVRPTIGGALRDVALHDMIIETADSAPIDLQASDQRLEDAFLAVFRQAAENDGFNRLVLAAGATWYEAAIVRAYASYMRQLSIPLGLRGIADVLLRHSGVVRDILELFHIRLAPDREVGSRAAAEVVVRTRIDGALANVASLDDDRILRHLVNLVGATLRTNVYQRLSDNQPPETIAFKFDSKAIDAAPAPRPYREIWVYSPRVEGVHLRFAPIARGGIRWSDRAQDFRTEVLGLVKAQLVKNAVIVPSGAKGGFYPKQLPRGGSRDDIVKEGVASYRSFIASLLSITDNIRDGGIVPPARVVRHDGDDPYLVVAADKGTATFSDFANEIATSHDFWLDDAFASGGSAGYDHKKMAITARGAWECVKRHFDEMNIDTQTQPFRVIGVGDMSGDVFGNGMLLSQTIELVAAFDHRDIFIDPAPDQATSFGERKRLFDRPRSSWQDYDRSKISKGGGVFSRSAKFIELTPEIKSLLGLKVERVTPNEIINGILKAEADLLWLGGIGTYVRGRAETDEQVGDRANDSIRVTASELRVKVIGEGANLGLTQRARVEFAQRGGRVNTDFIDNSAGVNSSDLEVNIKIALGRATRAGELAGPKRTAFLAQMTDEVAKACLRNNQQQSLALSLVERLGAGDIGRCSQLILALEKRGLVDRKLEALPDDAELVERRARGRGLTRPELSVLLSYSKIALLQDLLESSVPDEPRLEPWLKSYFPAALRERFADDIRSHRLRREIIATSLTNEIVNRAGPAFAVCLAEETNRSTADAVCAYLTARYVFDVPELADRIEITCSAMPAAGRLELLGRIQTMVGQVSGWFIRDGSAARQLEATISLHKSGAAQLAGVLDTILPASAQASVDQIRASLGASGASDDIARYLARLSHLRRAPEITAIATAHKRSIADAGRVFFAVGAYFGLDRLLERAAITPASDAFDRMAIAEAESQFISAHGRLAGMALDALRNGSEIETWLAKDSSGFRQIWGRIAAVVADQTISVSRLTVAASQLRDAIRI